MHLLTFALALTTAALPCSTPAHRAFDFWAGDWDGYDVGAEQVKAARVTVEIALDGCALYEVYEGTNGLVGRSRRSCGTGRRGARARGAAHAGARSLPAHPSMHGGGRGGAR